MKRKRNLPAVLSNALVAGMALAAGCDAPTDEGSQNDGESGDMQSEQSGPSDMLQDGEERVGDGARIVAEVQLAAGTRYLFVHIEDGSGIGIMEEQAVGAPAAGLEPALQDASPLDLFLAITDASQPIPEELLEYEDGNLGERGWFATAAAAGEYVVERGNCTNSTFQSYLRNWHTDINVYEKWRLHDNKDTSSEWTGPRSLYGYSCQQVDCNQSIWYYRHLSNTSFDVWNKDANKMALTACDIDVDHPAVSVNGQWVNYHLGPIVNFGYRTDQNAEYKLAWWRDLTASDEGNSYRWWWAGNSSPGYHDFDWRISMQHALEDDDFSMGFIYENRGY